MSAQQLEAKLNLCDAKMLKNGRNSAARAYISRRLVREAAKKLRNFFL